MIRTVNSIFIYFLTIMFLSVGGEELYSQCPTIVNRSHIIKDASIYYNLSDIPEPIKGQIQLAINSWNNALQSNGSGIRFISGIPSSATASTPILNFVLGGSSGSHFGDFITEEVAPVTSGIEIATIHLFTDGTFPDGTRLFDPTRSGYNTIFIKVALHEIGHAFCLEHPSDPQVPEASVLNNPMGTNDSWGRVPTTVQDCDTTALRSVYGSNGGGGGGSGGGSCIPRYDYEYDIRYVNDRPFIVGIISIYLGCW